MESSLERSIIKRSGKQPLDHRLFCLAQGEQSDTSARPLPSDVAYIILISSSSLCFRTFKEIQRSRDCSAAPLVCMR